MNEGLIVKALVVLFVAAIVGFAIVAMYGEQQQSREQQDEVERMLDR